MTDFLPKDVQEGLNLARKMARKRSSRLRIETDQGSFRVLHAWEDGFALEAIPEANLRGRIKLYDGTNLLSQCLIIAAELEGNEMRYEYKRMTEATDSQPLDYYKTPDAPVALIGQSWEGFIVGRDALFTKHLLSRL